MISDLRWIEAAISSTIGPVAVRSALQPMAPMRLRTGQSSIIATGNRTNVANAHYMTSKLE